MDSRIIRRFLAISALGLALSPLAGTGNAAPLVYVQLLARPDGTDDAFSSTITPDHVGEEYDYIVVATLAQAGTVNSNLPVDPNTLTREVGAWHAGDGLNAIVYSVFQSPTVPNQVSFQSRGYAGFDIDGNVFSGLNAGKPHGSGVSSIGGNAAFTGGVNTTTYTYSGITSGSFQPTQQTLIPNGVAQNTSGYALNQNFTGGSGASTGTLNSRPGTAGGSDLTNITTAAGAEDYYGVDPSLVNTSGTNQSPISVILQSGSNNGSPTYGNGGLDANGNNSTFVMTSLATASSSIAIDAFDMNSGNPGGALTSNAALLTLQYHNSAGAVVQPGFSGQLQYSAQTGSDPVVKYIGLTIADPPGTWTNTSGGNWSNGTNWQNGAIASGVGVTADFSTLTLGGNMTVHLDAPFTVGKLVFGDQGNTYSTTLDNGGNASNILTLAVAPASTPTITVKNQTATISAVIAGNQGFTVNPNGETGTLTLTANNTYSGTTTVNGGQLTVPSNAPLGNSDKLVLNGGGISASASFTLGGNILWIALGPTTGNGNGTINVQGATGYLNTAVTIASSGTGADSLTKTGDGTLYLGSGAPGAAYVPYEPYTGATIISGGTLAPAGSSLPPATAVQVGSAGTLDFGGTIGSLASITTGGSVVLEGNMTVGDTTNTAFSGVISGGGVLTKVGTGALTLTGNSTYADTNIFGGALVLDMSHSVSSPTNLLNPAGFLAIGSAALQVIAASGASQSFTNGVNFVGGAAVNVSGSGATLNLGAVYNGAGTVDFSYGSGSAITTTTVNQSNAILGGWATFGGGSSWATVDSSGHIDALGPSQFQTSSVGGDYDITNLALTPQPPATTQTFTVNSLRFNSSSGGSLTISSGAYLAIHSDGILVTPTVGSSAVTISGNAGSSGNSGFIIGGAYIEQYNTGTVTITSAISDWYDTSTDSFYPASVTKSGPGMLVLKGDNPFGYGLSILGGVVQAGSDGATALGTGGILIYGGTLEATSSFTLAPASGSITLGYGAGAGGGTIQVDGTNATLTVEAGVGGGYLAKTGAGTLFLGGAGGPSTLYVNAGSVVTGTASSINSTAVVIASGATLDLNGYSQAIGSLTGAGNVTNNGTAAATLTVGNDDTNPPPLSGAITNGASAITLVKLGQGTLTLAGANAYSGGTTLQRGQLNINSSTAIGTGPFAIEGDTIDNTSGMAVALTTTNAQTWESFTFVGSNSLSLGPGSVSIAGFNTAVTVLANTLSAGAVSVATTGGLEKFGGGVLEFDGPASLADYSGLQVFEGTLRFKPASGSPSVGTGVTASISEGAALELAGTAAALTAAVNVTNSSHALATGGLYVTGTNQVVGVVNGGGDTVVAAGGGLTAYQLVQNSLTIHGTATDAGSVTLAPSGSGSIANPTGTNNTNFSSNLASLSIDNNGGALLTGARVYYGTLDIGNNGLVIAYGSGADPYTSIDDMIRSGFDDAHWDGAGITSSIGRAAAESSRPLNIGLLDFTPNQHGDPAYIEFEGQQITTNAILVRLTYMDDLVLGGDMEQNDATSDALVFAANYGIGSTWAVGDVTHDGVIDSNDALFFAANFFIGTNTSLDGTTGNAAEMGAAKGLGSPQSVPEPSTLAMVAAGLVCMGMAARRRIGGPGNRRLTGKTP